MKKILEEIAKKELGLETLETRNSDSLDFREQAVWSIEEALKQAFVMGKKSATESEEYVKCPTCEMSNPRNTFIED